jgi:hypothetical protein
VVIRRQINHAPQGPIDLIVDSTGLKVYGQGEWHSQKHGEKRARRWKKLHIGVDAQGRIVASTVTESQEQDPSQIPELLAQVDGVIDRFIGDGIFDQAPVYTAVETHSPGARVIIPPRKDAVLSAMASTAPTWSQLFRRNSVECGIMCGPEMLLPQGLKGWGFAPRELGGRRHDQDLKFLIILGGVR